MAHDDDDEGGLYESGRWEWDSDEEGLTFVRCTGRPVDHHETNKKELEEIFQSFLKIPPTARQQADFYSPKVFIISTSKIPTGPIFFKDDMDLIEQQRYRKMYQRKVKPEQADVVTLQDVKDLAIYTAPTKLMNPRMIDMLHRPTMERFLRALIFYCQYYLQVQDALDERNAELNVKIRTHVATEIEAEFCTNLSDLRVLVGKEYATIILGNNDTKQYHHMGPSKARRSLALKDAVLHETLARMYVQIVWIAVGRKGFNKLELEINRLLRSNTFNTVEHNLKTGYVRAMRKEEKATLWGRCNPRDKLLYTRSPLMNEVYCKRSFDYRMLGLGVVNYPELSPRLNYMRLAISAPEEQLPENNVSVGILGMPRSVFDVTLHPIPVVISPESVYGQRSGRISRQSVSSAGKGSTDEPKLATNEESAGGQRRPSRISRLSVDPSGKGAKLEEPKLIKEILLPPKTSSDNSYFPDSCPTTSETNLLLEGYNDKRQRDIWIKRLSSMVQKRRF